MKPEDIPIKSAFGLIALTSLRGVGSATAEKLADRFETFAEVIEASARKFAGLRPIDEPSADEAVEFALRNMERLAALDVVALSAYDDLYPDAYRRIPDRPLVIYAKGDIEDLDRSVACIGTREPSEFGHAVADRVVECFVKDGWVVVSGLAIGVDTLCHEAALRHGGRTVAIMAGGLDSIYPKRNAHLAERILEQGGALISEQPLGTPAVAFNLVQRDRLQSGLAAGTFVVQTDIKGGSMHTVRFTLMQGRRLMAPVPTGRHAVEPKSQGILAISTLAGPAFANAVGATGEYARLLNSNFHDATPAFPVAGSQDYVGMLEELERSRLRSSIEPPTRQLAML